MTTAQADALIAQNDLIIRALDLMQPAMTSIVTQVFPLLAVLASVFLGLAFAYMAVR